MTESESIADKVKDFFSGSPEIEVEGMAELSTGAVAVIDNWNETDIYFDSKSYDLVRKDIWTDDKEKNGLFPPALEGTGLGVLPGIGRFPEVIGYDQALQFAKQHLKPITEQAQFYDEPARL